MADVETSSIRFTIEADTKSAVSSIESLKTSLTALQEKVSAINSSLKNIGFSGAAGSAKSATSNVKSLGNSVSKVAKAYKDARKASSALSNASGDSEKSHLMLPTVVPQADTQQASAPKAEEIKVNRSPLPDMSGMKQEAIPMPASTSKFKNALLNMSSQAKYFASNFKEVVGSGVSKSFELLGSAVSKVSSGMVSSMGKAATGIAKFGWNHTFGGLISGAKSAASAINGFVSSIGRIALYRFIRTVIKEISAGFSEGVQSVYSYSQAVNGSFAPAMDSIATSANYLKNSIGAMAAPLIQAVAPAINFVIDKLVSLVNVFNQVISAITGKKTFTKAVKVAKQFGAATSSAGSGASKAAKGVSNAGKAAKKAAKDFKPFLLGIDELNVIDSPDTDTSDSSGGSSGGAGGAGGSSGGVSGDDLAFEEASIAGNISDFAQTLKDAIKNGDWEGAGTLLGQKFNEVVNMVDWKGIGAKLGYGLNGAIQTIYYFLKEADFINLGNKIAEFFNGMIGQIDFKVLGRLIVRQFTAMIDFVGGLLGGLDWGLLARSASDLLIGAFEEINDWFSGFDWGAVGLEVYNDLKDAITNIDFSGIASAFFEALGKAIRSGAEFIGGFLSGLGSDIYDYFSESISQYNFGNVGLNIIYGVLDGILEAVVGIGEWLAANVIDPFVNGLIGEENWSRLKEAGSDIVNSVGEAISSGFKEFVKEIGKIFLDAYNAAIAPFLPIIKFFVDLYEGIKNVFKTVDKWFGGIFGKASNSTTSPFAKVKQFFSGVWNGITGIFKSAGTWFGSVFKNAKNLMTAPFNAVKGFFNGVWGGVTGIFKNAGSWFSSTFKNAKNLMTSPFNAVKSFFSGVWNGIKGVFGSNPNFFQQKFKGFASQVTGSFGGVHKFFSNLWNGIKSIFKGKISLPSISWPKIKLPHFSISGKFQLAPPKVPSVKITWKKDGGMFSSPSIVGVGEAGREAILPLDRNTRALDLISSRISSRMENGGASFGAIDYSALASAIVRAMNASPQHTTVEIDGRAVFEAVKSENRRSIMRTGKNPLAE